MLYANAGADDADGPAGDAVGEVGVEVFVALDHAAAAGGGDGGGAGAHAVFLHRAGGGDDGEGTGGRGAEAVGAFEHFAGNKGLGHVSPPLREQVAAAGAADIAG